MLSTLGIFESGKYCNLHYYNLEKVDFKQMSVPLKRNLTFFMNFCVVRGSYHDNETLVKTGQNVFFSFCNKCSNFCVNRPWWRFTFFPACFLCEFSLVCFCSSCAFMLILCAARCLFAIWPDSWSSHSSG